MEVIRKFAVWQMTNDCLPLLRPFKLHHPVSPPCSGYATQRKKFFLFKVNSYKLKPTHTDVKWDRSQIYGLVSHGFSDTPGIIGDGINSTQILVKEFRGAAWTLYSLEAGLFFFFFLLPEAGSTSTEPIRNHKPESKPVIKNFPCPPEHTISGVHDRVCHKTNMWKERSPLAHGIRQSSPSRWERYNRSHRVGSLWHRLNSRSRSGEGAAKLEARLPLKCFLTATALHQLFPSTWRSPSRPEQYHQLGIVRPWAFQGPFKFKQNHFLCFNCLSVSLLVFFL